MMDIPQRLDAVLAGERRAVAEMLSVVEGDDERRLRDVIAAVHPHTGRAHTVGVTGPPGVGKSTLTAQVVHAQRQLSRTVAVLAVDPSSPYSGGALLGDRVRMAKQIMDEGVYIRSMASRGHLGGLSWAAPHAVAVLDAAGFDMVIIETVGVGQAEVEIASLADSTVVVVAPGMGDHIQSAKAGILEIADVYVVNKADRGEADGTVRDLAARQHVARDGDAWMPPVLKAVASRGDGVGAIVEALDDHLAWANHSGARMQQRRLAAGAQVRELVFSTVRRRMHQIDEEGGLLDDVRDDVASGRRSPYDAAESLIQRIGTWMP